LPSPDSAKQKKKGKEKKEKRKNHRKQRSSYYIQLTIAKPGTVLKSIKHLGFDSSFGPSFSYPKPRRLDKASQPIITELPACLPGQGAKLWLCVFQAQGLFPTVAD